MRFYKLFMLLLVSYFLMPQLVANRSEGTDLRVYPQNYFRSPLNIPLVLAGTFGELRTNHFHAGIDCKTGGVSGKSIHAVGEGYVSRIRVSPRGYGSALYIDHPNGYTSMYAHLSRFTGNIGLFAKKRQYDLQSFEIDEIVPWGLLYVEKGQIVAKSGNTGSSTAPHLHFEFRDTQTEEAINPLLFGYAIADTRKPLIQKMGIYPMDELDKPLNPKLYKVTKQKSGAYTLPQNMFKVATPRVGLALNAYDKQNAANNLNGIYSLDMLDNGNRLYSFKMERIAFDESRYINSHLDYKIKAKQKSNMQKCFLDPNNNLSIYESVVNRGIIDLSDGLLHKITFLVRDVAGNTSQLSCMLQYDSQKTAPKSIEQQYDALFSYATNNYYNNDFVQLDFPYGCFYKDIPFSYKLTSPTKEQSKSVYSFYHQIHTNTTPVHKYYTIGIRPTTLPADLYDKAIIAYKDLRGRTRTIKSNWEGNFLVGETKYFGKYYITTDTQAPKIKVINIAANKVVSKNKTLTFKITDNLSGIASYNGYMDGQWILMEYDQKTARLRYRFDERVGKGKHDFRLVVTDGVGNEKVYATKLVR